MCREVVNGFHISVWLTEMTRARDAAAAIAGSSRASTVAAECEWPRSLRW
ncbi:MAG: hypothetical protein JOZ09_07040 [Pseudonocardiales bacterium]|nr:hypothetical protein [Pseudonocardiales bacterium]